MKFKDVESSEQGTSSVLNLTHPESVRKTAFVNGVGSCLSFLAGGANTATSNRPTMVPINIHSIANILL
jgi:hypothetical protein